MAKSKYTRFIKVFLDPETSRVKVKFSQEPFTPSEFTQIFMGILEAYTASLLESNTKESVFQHFNNAFGIFLNKLVPPEQHYELSDEHKAFKSNVIDRTLGMENTPEVQKETEDNRLAAYLLCREILVTDMGLTPESADLLLNKKLGWLEPPLTKGGEDVGEEK